MVTAVNPQGGLVSSITTGGTAVVVARPPIMGCYIVNPVTATEPLFVDPVGTPGLVATGTTVALAAGQSWNAIPGATTPVSVNAATAGHQFVCVRW